MKFILLIVGQRPDGRDECEERPGSTAAAGFLVAMEVETKFPRLFKPAALGNRIDGWRVCWIGGWDKCRVLFVAMVERPRPTGAGTGEL